MSVRLRFAPSPTGQVHIGNIRTAIFNWLLARHEGGTFLLRIEDTDLERSTPEAIATLLEVMDWLGLDVDETPMYQTTQRQRHSEAGEDLLARGLAYRAAKGGEGEALVFRIPWDAEGVPGVTVEGPVEWKVHPAEPVRIAADGVRFAGVSKKGKPVPGGACLAGFRDLEVFDAEGECLFRLADAVESILNGDVRLVEGATGLRFLRRSISYTDLVKGKLAKPLDSMKDFVIVRSDGSPVFHLANVCDDITQKITHIIRGDDHVENTYRHLFLFAALGAEPPHYAHLPMIVNAAGKPYSKRDGDAFVGDFRQNGFVAEALFNYLSLLGWNPGDEREKMSREELAAAFTLDRVQQSAARMDMKKLLNLNGRYIADMPFDAFLEAARERLAETAWGREADADKTARVARLMQSRTKRLTDVLEWDYFFVEHPQYDEKGVRKFLDKPGVGEALAELADALAEVDFGDEEALETVCVDVSRAQGIEPGRLNQPIRVAITGRTVGAGVYETMAVLGRDVTCDRLRRAVALIAERAAAGA